MLVKLTIKNLSFTKRITGKKTFEFGRVTILAGPNGSGKSSVLRSMEARMQKQSGSEKDVYVLDPPARLYFLDSEKTARNSGSFDETKDFGVQVGIRYMSHGEFMKIALQSAAAATEPSIFAVDEPESGLDLDGLFEYRELIQGSKHQFIVATHHPLFWTIPEAKIIVLGKDKEYVRKCQRRFQELLP